MDRPLGPFPTASVLGAERVHTVVGALGSLAVVWVMWIAARAVGYGRTHHRMWEPAAPGEPTAVPTGTPLDPSSAWTLVLLAGCLAVAVGLLGRQAWPRVAYLLVAAGVAAYLAAGGPVPFALPAPAIALVSLSAARPGTGWPPWLPVLVPMLTATGWREPYLGLTSATLWPTVLVGVAAIMVPTLIAEVRRDRRAAMTRAYAEEMRRVAYRERMRLAQDLHDVVGHSLSTISLQAGVALRFLDQDPAQARASLEAIRTSARDSLTDVRRTIGVLRDPAEGAPLAPGPTLDRLDDLVDPLVAGGADIAVRTDPALARTVPTPVQQVAYRIIQEGLTNAVRHAPGAPVEVVVVRRADHLNVRVADGGPAPTRPLVEGNGLRGMRERIRALGGTLDVDASGPGGVVLSADLPLELAPADLTSDPGGGR